MSVHKHSPFRIRLIAGTLSLVIAYQFVTFSYETLVRVVSVERAPEMLVSMVILPVTMTFAGVGFAYLGLRLILARDVSSKPATEAKEGRKRVIDDVPLTPKPSWFVALLLGLSGTGLTLLSLNSHSRPGLFFGVVLLVAALGFSYHALTIPVIRRRYGRSRLVVSSHPRPESVASGAIRTSLLLKDHSVVVSLSCHEIFFKGERKYSHPVWTDEFVVSPERFTSGPNEMAIPFEIAIPDTFTLDIAPEADGIEWLVEARCQSHRRWRPVFEIPDMPVEQQNLRQIEETRRQLHETAQPLVTSRDVFSSHENARQHQELRTLEAARERRADPALRPDTDGEVYSVHENAGLLSVRFERGHEAGPSSKPLVLLVVAAIIVGAFHGLEMIVAGFLVAGLVIGPLILLDLASRLTTTTITVTSHEIIRTNRLFRDRMKHIPLARFRRLEPVSSWKAAHKPVWKLEALFEFGSRETVAVYLRLSEAKRLAAIIEDFIDRFKTEPLTGLE